MKGFIYNKRIYTIISFLFLYVLTILFLIWRAHQGIGSSDEYFYATEGLRLASGDRLFVDDWHIAQLMAVFLAPLVKLSKQISPNYEGVILQFRIYYVIFTSVIGLLIFFRFYKTYGFKAIGASLIYMLFSPFQIMALSYNTMGPGFVIMALLIYPNETPNRLRYFLFGVFMAFAVLNMPYLVLLYVLLTVLVIIKHRSFSKQAWLYTTLGAFTVATLFLCFLFSRISFTELTQAFPHLIDPSHSDSLLLKIAKNGYRSIQAYHVFLLLYVLEVIMAFRFRKGKTDFSPIKFSAIANSISILVLSFITGYQISMGGYVVILLPFVLTGIVILLVKRSDHYLISWIITSIVLSIAISLSSNVGPSSFICPLIIGCIATVLLLEEKIEGQVLTVGLVLLLIFFKVTTDFGSDMRFNTIVIQEGPLKGLTTSETELINYESSLEDMKMIQSLPIQNASLVTYSNWGYFTVQKTISANSTYLYFWDRDSYVEAEDEYYELHSDRYPAYVYVDNHNGYFKDEDSWLGQFEIIMNLKSGVLYLRK